MFGLTESGFFGVIGFALLACYRLRRKKIRVFFRKQALVRKYVRRVLGQYRAVSFTGPDMLYVGECVRLCAFIDPDTASSNLGDVLGCVVRFGCRCPWNNLVCTEHYVWPDPKDKKPWKQVGYTAVWRMLNCVCLGDRDWQPGDPPERVIGFDKNLKPTFVATRVRVPCGSSRQQVKKTEEIYRYCVVWGQRRGQDLEMWPSLY